MAERTPNSDPNASPERDLPEFSGAGAYDGQPLSETQGGEAWRRYASDGMELTPEGISSGSR